MKIASFLAQTEFMDAAQTPLAGDASGRSYRRLRHFDGRSFILMIAPPETGERTKPFYDIATHLRSIGLSAPEIYAWDAPSGLMLIEDLGEDLFSQVCMKTPEKEPILYEAALDVLVHIAKMPLPSAVVHYTADMMADYIDLLDIHYARALGANDLAAFKDLQSHLQSLLEENARPPVLALRDYHAENLLWCPDRSGVRAVGLLDFQDAVLADPAYDLASLLDDARRQVTPGFAAEMQALYATKMAVDIDETRRACALQGAQRNMRIIGIFCKLAQAGKPNYLSFIPRVWEYLMMNLAHPDLHDLAACFHQIIPAPEQGFEEKVLMR
ncbi:MAG: aminoglycoside phosphotransferase family protein [Halocynthiibacter sp.]